jgi:hypothetical protein
MQKRSRFKQSMSPKERLASFAQEARDQAAKLPPGSERDDLLEKARQADATKRLEDWVNSPGLRPPT